MDNGCIQVAAAQPKDKQLAAEKRRVKRRRLVKPKTGTKESSPGAPPRLSGITPTSIPDGPDDAQARVAPDDCPVKLGAPSPLPSPMRSTAGESEAQPGSGPASPTCTSYDVTTPESVDSPPMVPPSSKSAINRDKQSDDKVDVREKASSPRSPQKAAAELLYEKLYDMNYAPVTDYAFLVGYYGSNQKTAAYRPPYCAHKVEASYKVLALGVVARLTVLDRRVIDGGFKSLVSAASGRIWNSAWMDDEDKVRMITKFASVSMGFLPPEAVLEDGALEGLYEEFPENRPYGYISNTVQLAIGAAAAPAYYSSGTEAMLYGGLLFLLAMQMVKAVDEEGIRWYMNQTALDNTFLSNASLQAFRDRSECRYAAGNESAFPEVPALEIAYAALKESHLERNTEPLALSEQLPEDKVFFMTLCYMACGNVHVRGDIAPDCNKVVRNSDAFARVYACAKGSKMNPEKKCSFFA
ncbi:hypothetical protein HPB52_009789 [Rhipicephalus sanguineus]|uniref:Peptidase M13 C-terminal domain-containing protein n=1 Tax=Rhipicephalus sanguineus TaxID=34632 RepID=A0A9D4PLW3_RHISA|nr:hypothetical protein HPB52_009789 [Rhipicephalus sanguineus]